MGEKQGMVTETTNYSYDEVLEASLEYFQGDELAAKVFADKYALRSGENVLIEKTPTDMHRRIAKEFARIEASKFKKPMSEDEIFGYLDHFSQIVPQGSPMYAIGNRYQTVSTSNCFVLDSPVDSYGGILMVDEQLVQICKRRGGVGTDISNLRPSGTITRNAARTSTGIVSFMERYSHSIREVGQCIAEGERVLTREGLKVIEDVIPRKDEVWTKTGWVKVLDKVSNGQKKIWKTTTSAGYEVKTTDDHLFLSEEDGSLVEKRIVDCKEGDRVVLSCGPFRGNDIPCGTYVRLLIPEYSNANGKPDNCNLPNTLDENLAYLIGYSYGGESVQRNENGEPRALELACSNSYPDIIKKLGVNISNLFSYESHLSPGDGDITRIRLFNKRLVNFLDKNSLLKQEAGDIIFPKKIIHSPVKVQMAFISGFFDADGYAGGRKRGYVFSSISFSFIKSLQTILLSVGVPSKIHSEHRENNWKTIYSLCVVGSFSQERLVALLTESSKVMGSNFIAKRDCWLSPYKAKSFGIKYNKHNYCPDNSQNLSLAACSRLKKDGEFFGEFLFRDKIATREFLGDLPTFDLVLESEHLFWCEGFCVHNSGRRGALMLTLSVHHPEISDFISVKRDLQKVTGANISVRLSDEFLKAVEKDTDVELRWPVDAREKSQEPKISCMVRARDVWKEIITCAHAMAEPGVLFWDNILKESPADCYAKFGFKTTSTNPCSEIGLCPLDSCRLLVINLFSCVNDPFTKKAKFDFNKLHRLAGVAQRFMDDLIDLELEAVDRIIDKIRQDPEGKEIKKRELCLWKRVREKCENGRRTGTGITALGDALAASGIAYGSKESISAVRKIYRTLKLGAYRSSVNMAKELGPFPIWDHDLEKNNPFFLRIKKEDEKLWNDMKRYGRRNIALLTTAPTGSVSILTQTTSGIEPLFMMGYTRRKKIVADSEDAKVDFVDDNGDKWQEFVVYHPKVKMWMDVTGKKNIKKSPWHSCCAEDLDWEMRVKLQAAAQEHLDHSISSTVNVPENVSVDEVAKIYETAHRVGCKGITVYRKNCRVGVLIDKKDEPKMIAEPTVAPKRPRVLEGEVYHTSVKGDLYFVIVGLYEKVPYEVFAGKNGCVSRKVRKATITKIKRGHYRADFDDGTSFENIGNQVTEDQEAITRLISMGMRHGNEVSFTVHQLEKVRGDMMSFSRAIARTLKKYILDGTSVKGESCPKCSSESSLVRQEGCVVCRACGWTKCM